MKTAIITGASGGMGLATAKRLIREGYKVYGLDIRPPKNLKAFPKNSKELRENIRKDLPMLHFIQTDLTDSKSVAHAFSIIRKQVKNVDCLIHMAGIYDLNSLVEMSEESFIRIFNINLFSVYRVNKAFLPLLKKGSRILITSSELAPLDPLPFTGIYGITKTAIEHYAYSLRMELQLLGIKVIILRPGAVDTGLLNVSTDRLEAFCKNTKLYPTNAKRFRRIVDSVESRKVVPEKIASLAVYAVTDPYPNYVYKINRSPLLLLMNGIPDHLQHLIIRLILQQ